MPIFLDIYEAQVVDVKLRQHWVLCDACWHFGSALKLHQFRYERCDPPDTLFQVLHHISVILTVAVCMYNAFLYIN